MIIGSLNFNAKGINIAFNHANNNKLDRNEMS